MADYKWASQPKERTEEETKEAEKQEKETKK